MRSFERSKSICRAGLKLTLFSVYVNFPAGVIKLIILSVFNLFFQKCRTADIDRNVIDIFGLDYVPPACKMN